MTFKQREAVNGELAAELDRQQRRRLRSRGKDVSNLDPKRPPYVTSRNARTWNRTDKLPTWKGYAP